MTPASTTSIDMDETRSLQKGRTEEGSRENRKTSRPRLPVELYRNIVEQFEEQLMSRTYEKGPLLNLCLTSRAISAEATRILYRNCNLEHVFGDCLGGLALSREEREQAYVDVMKCLCRTIDRRPELAQLVRGLKFTMSVGFEQDPSDVIFILDHLPHLHTVAITKNWPLMNWGGSCPDWIAHHTLNIVDFSFQGGVSAAMFAHHPRLRYLSVGSIDYENWFTSEGYLELVSFQCLYDTCLYSAQNSRRTGITHLSTQLFIDEYGSPTRLLPAFPDLVGLHVQVKKHGDMPEDVLELGSVLRTIYNLAESAPNLRLLWIQFSMLKQYKIPDNLEQLPHLESDMWSKLHTVVWTSSQKSSSDELPCYLLKEFGGISRLAWDEDVFAKLYPARRTFERREGEVKCYEHASNWKIESDFWRRVSDTPCDVVYPPLLSDFLRKIKPRPASIRNFRMD